MDEIDAVMPSVMLKRSEVRGKQFSQSEAAAWVTSLARRTRYRMIIGAARTRSQLSQIGQIRGYKKKQDIYNFLIPTHDSHVESSGLQF